jgi:hypothetical protein
MLQQITWSEYWKIIVIISVLYECSILLLFYRKEILLLAKGKRWVLPIVRARATHRQDVLQEKTSLPRATEEENEEDNEDENLIPFANELAESIKVLIGQAAEKEYAKEELFFGLQRLIKGYPQLKDTSYRQEINTLISVECKTKCALHLRTGELDKLWLS